MSDARTASPLIRKGQAVLGYADASAMDREHCARPIARLRTYHSDVTKRHRAGDWQLRRIFSGQRAAFAPSDHNTSLTRAMARPFTLAKSVG